MINFLEKFYGVLALIALVLGLVVAVIFAAALIAGQGLGNDWATFGGEIMTWGIGIAAVAVLAGLVIIYATRSHSLKMEKSSEPPSDETQ